MAEMSGGWLTDPTFIRRLAPVGVLGAVLILADQIGQMVASLPAFDPGYPTWRFQAATLLTSRFTGLGLAALLLYAVSVWTGSRRVGRTAGVVVGGLLAALVATVAVLWFDGPSVKEQVPAARLIEFVLQWIRVLVMAALGVLVGAALLIGFWRGRGPTTG